MDAPNRTHRKQNLKATGHDPVHRAAESARQRFWSIKGVPPDVGDLVSRAIKAQGRNKAWWVAQCIRAHLGPRYGGKKTLAPAPL